MQRLQFFLFLSFISFFTAMVFPLHAEDSAEVPIIPLTIHTAAGTAHIFNVEVATTRAVQVRGLMFRESLAEDGGMLFLYTKPQLIRMWMKNTLIPLDMLFIDAEGVIQHIHTNAKPHSTTLISAPVPVPTVLEMKGGTVEQLGIAEGDRVVWRPL